MTPLGHWMLPALVATTLATSPAWAQATVEGAVTYDARRVAMTHVYARETRGSPTRDEPPQVLILITDRPAPAKVIASRQAYYAAAQAGEIRGFLLTLEKPDSPPRLAIFVPGAYDDTSVPDVFSQIDVTELKREGDVVSGRLKSNEPREFSPDSASPETPLNYAIDVRFQVPVIPVAKPTQVLTGPPAQSSEQVTVAQRMLQLLRTGTNAQIKAELVPDHPLAQALDSGESSPMLEVARKILPAAATFRPSVQRVIVYGEESAVVAKDSEGLSTVWLRRVGGQWKLAAPPISND